MHVVMRSYAQFFVKGKYLFIYLFIYIFSSGQRIQRSRYQQIIQTVQISLKVNKVVVITSILRKKGVLETSKGKSILNQI